jgi:hypothetical protein
MLHFEGRMKRNLLAVVMDIPVGVKFDILTVKEMSKDGTF